VLTDFGLATFVDDGSVTGPGLVVGSPQYVSPERARDGASTVESDLWSLGATLYAAVEGRSPYARESAMATLMALATEPPDPARSAGPLTPVLDGLLRHEPADRLTAHQVEQRLRAIAGGHPAPHPSGRAPVPAQRLPAQRLPAQRLPVRPPLDRITVAQDDSVPPRAPSEPPITDPLPGRSRLATVLVGLLVLALLAGGVGATYLMQRGDETPQSAGPSATGSSSTAGNAGAGAVGGFSPIVCDREPAANAQKTPQPGAKQTMGDWTLISGFSYFTDTSGFNVGVPDGWRYERVGTTVCFWDPGNIRILSIDSGRNPKGDPVKACRTEAKRLVEAGALPGYEQIDIVRAPLAIKAADWEYRYDGADDVRMHANTRWFATGGKAFALGWMTRDFEWDQNKATVNLIQSSFRVTTDG
jgi:hypothetical protein